MHLQLPNLCINSLITEDHSKAAKDARGNRAAVNFLVKNMKGPIVICDQQLASAATFRKPGTRSQGHTCLTETNYWHGGERTASVSHCLLMLPSDSTDRHD
jgi:hypothetical protein